LITKYITKVSDSLKRNRVLVENFGYLSILEFFNVLLPLITYPYLILTLGKNYFGLVILAQAIISYFVIFVSFGFNMSATKEISIHRNNKAKLNEIVSTVLFVKGMLLLIAFLILLSFINFIPGAKGMEVLLILSMWMCLYDFIFPVWFFQGYEKMKYITYLTLISRITALILIFVLIKSPDDYLKVPIISGIGAVLAGSISLYILISHFKIKLTAPSTTTIKKYISESYVLFLSDVIIAIKDKANYILIGMFIGTGAVTEFDLALKVKSVLSIPIDLINKAIYPKVSKEKNMGLMKKAMRLTLLLTTSLTIIAFLFAKPITSLLGGAGMESVVTITRIILLSVPVFTISYFLAVNCINALGEYKLLLHGMLFTTGFYIILIIFGYLTQSLGSLVFIALIAVLTYIFELGYRYYIVKKKSLI